VLKPGWQVVSLLAWGVLTFGAVYAWAYWPLFLASAVFGVHATLTERAWRDPRLKLLIWAFVALSAGVALQIIALPAWLASAISPGIDAFFRQFRIGYHPAELQTLSLDPAATAVVLAEIVAFALLLIGTARLMRRWPLEWLVNQLMALAVAVALVGILQRAIVGPEISHIYGFWRPRLGGQPFGPFVNRNHFAGWMVMMLPLVSSLGWGIVQRAHTHRRQESADWLRWVGGVDGNRALLVLSCVLIMAVSLVMTGSRSGMVACAIAMTAFLLFIWRTTRGATRWIVTGLVVAVLSGATLWAGAGTVAGRFSLASGDAHGRLSAWRDTWQIVRDFPLTGTGLGGYKHAMLVYQTGDREAIYAQAHNDYLQVLAEGGAMVAIPAAGVVLIVVAGIRRRLRGVDDDVMTFWMRRGAVAGLVGVAAQSVVEFSLQMPGNAAMCVVLVALALHRPRPYSHAHRF
jgi:O-antigen ligase